MKRTESMWNSLKKNNRFYILLFSGWLSLSALLLVMLLIKGSTIQIIRLEQIYGFTSLGFLYLALLATPLSKILPRSSFKEGYLHARRAIGVSSFYFALLHAGITLFGQLGGFHGLGFVPANYVKPLLFGAISLAILFLMAITSIDRVIDFMGFPRWKLLHRFIYVAGLLVVLHVYIIGTHFSKGRTLLTGTLGFLVLLLLVLEAMRLIIKGEELYKKEHPMRLVRSALIAIGLIGAGFLLGPVVLSKQSTSGNIHAAHELSADSAAENNADVNATDPDYVLSLDQTSFSQAKLVTGEERFTFTVKDKSGKIITPTETSCLLISRVNLTPVAVFPATPDPSNLSFLPLGDNLPPVPGDYNVYLSFKARGKTKVIGVDLVIKK